MLKFYVWPHGIHLLHAYAVVMFHEFFLFLPFYGFFGSITDGYAVLISFSQCGKKLLSSLELYFNLGAYSFLILLEHLERLVKAC